MKKVLAILLAAMMAFSAFGMVGFAADPEISDDDVMTLEKVLQIADGMKDATGLCPTVLVFNVGSCKLGSVYQNPTIYYINAGANRGCYAMVSESFVAGNHVQLPAIKDAGDGMAANWMVQTNVAGEQGRTYGSASDFTVPREMKDRPQTENFIVFYAQLVPNEQTPVIAKIMNIFYKIIKVLFGQELADKFGELMLEFGVAIEA